MLDLSQLNMDYVALHRVGNKSREESNFESGSLLNPSPEVEVALLTFFLGPFAKSRKVMRFTSELGPTENHMFKVCSSIFSNPKDLLAGSADILNHLFEQSTHPHIRSGELFVTYFTDMVYGDEVTDAIGIFKAETLHDFVKVSEEGFERLLTDVDEGILVDKLDKGCIIVNTDKEEGYAVISVDSNNYDAAYWKDNFLGLGVANDVNFQTTSYLELCQQFTDEVFAPEHASDGKPEQMAFMNDAVQYMAENEVVKADEFIQAVIKEPAMQTSFMELKEQHDAINPFPIEDEFSVSKPALKAQQRKIKNQIELDTNIQIKLPFGPDGGSQFIERGYDESRGMYFYKVFFNSEKD
ncbi:MAG: hypothetical protein ACI85F_001793 [Bacteroidia bacterium]|jgi:hypothetical protein